MLDGPVRDVPADPNLSQWRPRLASRGDGSVALVVGLGPPIASLPTGPTTGVGSVTFSPWGDWPASLYSLTTLTSMGGGDFVVAPAPAPPGIAMAWTDPGQPPQTLPRVRLDPAVPGDMVADGFYLPASPPTASFLALASNQLFFGASGEQTPGNFALALGWAAPGGGQYVMQEVGCGTQPLVASASPVGDHAIVAYSSGAPFGKCGIFGGVYPVPKRLQIARWNAPQTLVKGTDMTLADGVIAVATAPRSDGAWVVWEPPAGNTFPPVLASHTNLDGVLAGTQIELTPAGYYSGPLATTSANDALVFAWVIPSSTAPFSIQLEVVGDAGITSTLVFEAGLPTAELSLLASPDGSHVLVAWADSLTYSNTPMQAHVARFACGQ